MKRFIALVLSLVMALSLCAPAWGAGGGPAAQIGTAEYDTLQAACAAAKDGDTITLLKDIVYTSATGVESNGWYDGVKYTGDQSFTINLNGKTISDNGTLNDYLLYFINKGTKANEITLKNGTISGGANLWNVISVGASSETYPTTFNLGGNLTINADGSGNSGEDGVAKVRGKSVMNVLSGTTVVSTNAMYGVQAASSTATLNIYDGATVTMSMNSPYAIAVTGTGIVNIYGGTITSTNWAVHTSSSGTPVFTISGGTITGTAGAVASCADLNTYSDADPSVTISGGAINGKVSELVYGTPTGTAGGELTVTGGTFDTDVSAYLADGYELKNGEVTKIPAVAKVGDVEYTDLQTAVNAGDTVTLLRDVTLPCAIEVNEGADVTLDLAGKTISQTKAQTGAYAMIVNNGTLTIKDSVGTGVISYTDSGTGGEYASNTICNNGVLNVTGGTIENMSSDSVAAAGYPHAIDVYQGSTTNITGGTVKSLNYDAIRMFCNSTTEKTEVNISGGTIHNRVTFQVPGASAAYGVLNITGGTFTNDLSGDDAKNTNVRLLLFGTDLTNMSANISGGNFDEGLYVQNNTGSATAPAWTPITGGYFNTDPSDYCAEGKTGVASDKSGYLYMVDTEGTNVAEIKPADPEVDVNEKLEGDNKTAADAIAATGGVTLDNAALNAVAKDVANENKVSAETGATELKEEGVTVDANDTVTIVVQPYFDVAVNDVEIVKDATTGDVASASIELDITPMYQTVATTANVANDEEIVLPNDERTTNAVVVDEGKLEITEPVTITVKIPGDLAKLATNGILYVTHAKDNGTKYVYEAAVVGNDTDGYTATFTNPHGFSTFTLSAENTTVATVAGVNYAYASLQSAINDAGKDATITLSKGGQEATVRGATTFTVEYTGEATVDNTKIYAGGNAYLANKSVNGNKVTYEFKVSYGYYVPTTPSTGTLVESAKTFDGGITLAVAVSVLSVTGSAVLLRKKED